MVERRENLFMIKQLVNSSFVNVSNFHFCTIETESYQMVVLIYDDKNIANVKIFLSLTTIIFHFISLQYLYRSPSNKAQSALSRPWFTATEEAGWCSIPESLFMNKFCTPSRWQITAGNCTRAHMRDTLKLFHIMERYTEGPTNKI